MSLRQKQALLALALVLALGGSACSNEITIVDGSGSGSGASSGTGSTSTGPASREIDLAYGLPPSFAADPDQLLVMLNHVDGSLVQSWRGGQLPTKAIVDDGDLVTYANLTGGTASYGPAQDIVSYRVTPGVHRIEPRVSLEGQLTCDFETMHVTVHLPAFAGASMARVAGQSGGNNVTYELPADIPLDVHGCGGPATRAVLTTIDGPAGYLAFELDEVPFVADSSVELTPTFATAPRAKLAITVDMLGDSDGADAHAHWTGNPDEGDFFGAPESGFDVKFSGDAPFEYAPSLVDLPHGYPFAYANVVAPPKGDVCLRVATVFRLGASSTPIVFHATELALPVPDGDRWALEAGLLGDTITRHFFFGERWWRLVEDPASASYPAVFPTFPASVPGGFVVPQGTPTLSLIHHGDDEGLATYADVLAQSSPFETHTLRTRTSHLICDWL